MHFSTVPGTRTRLQPSTGSTGRGADPSLLLYPHNAGMQQVSTKVYQMNEFLSNQLFILSITSSLYKVSKLVSTVVFTVLLM